MAYNVGPNGGRSRQRYAQYLPNIQPYEFIEDVSEAQSQIADAGSEADAARGERRGSTEAEAAAFLFLSDTLGAFRDSFKLCSSRKKHLACIWPTFVSIFENINVRHTKLSPVIFFGLQSIDVDA